MYVFLLIIIPLMYFVSEYLCHNRKIDRSQLFCIFWGFVIACIYTLIDFFAVGASHEWINSFSSVWAHYLITETLLPVIVCIIPIVFAKDSFRIKIQYFFPLLTAFMVIFIPYKIISETSIPDLFRMIMYPLLVAAMLFNFDTASTVFDEERDMMRLLPVRCLVAFFAVSSGIVLPTLFQTLYFLNQSGAGLYILAVACILSAAGLRAVEMIFLRNSK